MKLYLRLLAPYIAVVPCWVVLENAWLTIVVYHAQILIWSYKDLKRVVAGWNLSLFIKYSVPCLLTVVITYFLLPVMTGDHTLAGWLSRYGLEGVLFMLMIPYFGLVHPILEQTHWYALRRDSRLSHLCFAGYHAIVLHSLISPLWLAFCIGILVLVSMLWAFIDRQTDGGFIVPVFGHIFADTGIVLAAYALL